MISEGNEMHFDEFGVVLIISRFSNRSTLPQKKPKHGASAFEYRIVRKITLPAFSCKSLLPFPGFQPLLGQFVLASYRR